MANPCVPYFTIPGRPAGAGGVGSIAAAESRWLTHLDEASAMTEGMSDWQGWLYVAAVLIPLAAFTVELLGGRWLGRLNAVIATLAIGTSCVLSVVGFLSYVYSAPAILSPHQPAADEPASHTGPAEEHAAVHGPLVWKGSVNWVALGAGLYRPTPNSGGEAPPLVIPLGIHIDNLAAIMFVMVTFIATLIHVYSIGYMRDDPRFPLFFTYLSLFCFSMLGLVAASNIFMVFVFWELVGVCSYLLIGFWYEDKKNVDAANKAFVTNRIGDVGMLLGLGLLWAHLGTFAIDDISRGLRDDAGRLNMSPSAADTVEVRNREGAAPLPEDLVGRTIPYWALGLAGFGVFAGCMGKSAQFPLHVWLPDAMAGPTPVSALIHAATMVAAGVYLVGRFFPVFTADVLLYIAYTGGITLFIAATIATVQTDYKKVLAYSTVSQLGFMMLGLGVGGWAAGLFHLITHAFFKALLFLGAGSIYHAVHTYEMPALGGLLKKMPITGYTMLVGTLAISGVPLFSGFYSKDAILASSLYFVQHNPQHLLLFVLPTVGAALTAFYMFRLWFLVFAGEPRGFPASAHGHGAHGHDDHHSSNPVEHAHESPPIMTWPLLILAVPTIMIGWPVTLLPFFGFEPVLEGMLAYGEPIRAVNLESAKYWAMGASVLIASVGIGLGVFFYSPWEKWRRFDAKRSAERLGPVYSFLVHKWYFDELYDALLVRPTLLVARWATEFDRRIIDGVVNGVARITVLVSWIEGGFDQLVVDRIVNLVARITYVLGDWSRVIQTGRLRNYLMILALAIVVLFVGLFTWVGGPRDIIDRVTP
jgi:proton-translocating NADH-quinone oxidoreductase chain L